MFILALFLSASMFITIYLGYHLRRDLNKYVAFNDIFIGIFLFLGMDSLTVDPTGLYLCGLSFCLNAFLAILWTVYHDCRAVRAILNFFLF